MRMWRCLEEEREGKDDAIIITKIEEANGNKKDGCSSEVERVFTYLVRGTGFNAHTCTHTP